MKRSRLVGFGAAAATATAVGAAVLTRRSVKQLRARTNPELDPLYDVPADVVHHEIPMTDGAVIHALERGEGRPLLLIHGITLQAAVWSPQLHQLADRFRVIAIDVRGHGRSTVGADGVGREVAARDVAEVLAHFDLRDAVVVGHSMGGMILMQFAGDHPQVLADRVGGLVFMDTAAFQILPPLVQPVGKAMGRRMVHRLDAGKRVPQRQIGDDDASWFFTRLAFGADPPAKAVDQVRRFLAEVPQSTSLPSGVDLLDHDARDALAATATPSLVLVGSRDLLTPVWAARQIAKFLPDARLEVLPGAGHQLMQERPFEVAELLDAFAARIGSAGQWSTAGSVAARSSTNGHPGAR